MKVTASLPTGVAALFFESARRRRLVEEAMVARLEAGGFSEVLLPIVDYADPYDDLPSLVRRGELYRFVDRDGELLALRADFTPLLARLVAPRLAALALPLRLYYRGDVLRYEEPRAGRERESYQLGAEILGLAGGPLEEEALRRFLELLAAVAGDRGTGAGAGDRPPVVVLGFAGALDAQLLAHGGGDPLGLARAIVRRERRTAREASPALLAVVENGLPADPADLGPEAAARLGGLVALRDRLAGERPEVELKIDLAELADQVVAEPLRRLGARAYYDGLVFRAFVDDGAVPVGGGGRYDRLFRSLGAETTAAGFSLSVDRLAARPERIC